MRVFWLTARLQRDPEIRREAVASADRTLDTAQAFREVAPFTFVRSQRECVAIIFSRLFRQSSAPLQLGASGVEQVVILKIFILNQLLDDPEAAFRAIGHCDRHRPIQRNHRRCLHAHKLVIPLNNSFPIGIFSPNRAAVLRGDGSLQAHTDPCRPAKPRGRAASLLRFAPDPNDFDPAVQE